MDIIDKAPLPYFFVTGPDEGHRKKASTRRDRWGHCHPDRSVMVAVLPAPYHKLIMSDPGMERRTLAARCLAALEQTPSLDLFPFHLLQEKERRWLARQAEIRNFEPGEQVAFAARSTTMLHRGIGTTSRVGWRQGDARRRSDARLHGIVTRRRHV